MCPVCPVCSSVGWPLFGCVPRIQWLGHHEYPCHWKLRANDIWPKRFKTEKIVLATGKKNVKKDIDRAGRSLITIESREGHPRLLMTSSFAVHSPPHHHHCLLFISFTLQLTLFLSCRCHQTFCLAYLKTFLWKQFRLKSGGHKKQNKQRWLLVNIFTYMCFDVLSQLALLRFQLVL